MINSRHLEDLDPEARIVCNDHCARCHAEGIELMITSTWRDNEAQSALWLVGRGPDDLRRTVTNAKAGHSWHNFRVAWDVVPLVYGKCDWVSRYPNGKLTPLWLRVVTLGKEAGALAGADWPSKLVDDAHFYIAPDKEGLHITMDEARERFQTNGTIFTA